MTRETKIGLLVGLAFIIVIGILLSDHMTSTTQPPQAALAESGASNVRESVTAPAPSSPAPTPITSVPQITPAHPVLSQSELRLPVAAATAPQAPAGTAVTQVHIGGPAVQQPAGTPIAIHQTESPIPAQQQTQSAEPTQPVKPVGQPQQPGEIPVTTVGEAVSTDDSADTGSSLEEWSKKLGEPIVPVKKAAPKDQVTAGPMKEYTAQAGDSLSRIASRVMGANTKANREAIVKANASLQKNPELIIEGRKYMIPDSVKTAAKPSTPADQTPGPIPAEASARPAKAKTKAVPVTELVDAIPPGKNESPAGGWYVVKENDNLWRIANEQLGSGNAWTQIKDLNKDILKGGETVHVNMRLRLPGKPLASAN